MVEEVKEELKRILKNDEEAIKWLKEYVEKNKDNMPALKEMTEALYTEAEYRLTKLKEEENDKISEVEMKQTDAAKILEDILNDKNYVEKYLIEANDETDKDAFRLGIFENEDEIKEIQEDKEFWEKVLCLSNTDLKRVIDGSEKANFTDAEIEKLKNIGIDKIYDTKGKLRKVLRFYNMQAKHAHTAKAAYIALYTSKKRAVEDMHLTEIALTSTVLHDLGRFYQAGNYDDFVDGHMKGDPKVTEYNMPGCGHSIIGYYYSMMRNFPMNCFGGIDDPKLEKMLIASFVVRYHSLSNGEFTKLEPNRTGNCKKVDSVSFEEFLFKVFKNAEPLVLEEHVKEDIKNLIYNMVEKKVTELSKDLGESFGYNSNEIIKLICNTIMETINDDKKGNLLKKAIEFFSQKYVGTDDRLNQIAEEFSDVINAVLKEKFGEGYTEKMEVTPKDFFIGLKEMADYDIAASAFGLLGKDTEYEQFNELFYYPLIITTDSDKIDILNQMAQDKMPNEVFNPEKYNIWLKEDMTAKEIYNELGLEKKIEFSDFCLKFNLKEEETIKAETPISIPAEWCRDYWYQKHMNKNKEKTDINSEPKLITAIMESGDDENFFKFNGMKISRKGVSSLRITLWRINQFLFTNMRFRSSFEIIRDIELIEDIYKNFGPEDRKIIRPYIEYTLYFIEKSINAEKELDTENAMKEHSEKVKTDYDDPEMDKEIKQKCIARLDEIENSIRNTSHKATLDDDGGERND